MTQRDETTSAEVKREELIDSMNKLVLELDLAGLHGSAQVLENELYRLERL